MTNLVTCPHCGHQFSPDEALTHQLEGELRTRLEKELAEKAKEAAQKELADRDAQITELKDKAKKSADAELKLLQEKRALKDAQDNFQLEKERAINEEREKIRDETTKAILEKEKYKIEEYEKKLRDMQKAVEEAQRKGAQGSQQLQGEVQELDLETTLRAMYPYDEIGEVKKGENGADIRETVRTEKGTVCGKILWESKRTKAWSEGWVGKLKEDLRRDGAQLAAIITQAMPPDVSDAIASRQGIWVVRPEAIAPLSALLRKNLIDVAYQKVVATHKQTKAENLYDYVTSNAFAQNVERIIRVYLEMKTQIAKEATNAERSFKQRNMQVDMLLSGMGGLYGDMQAIAGSSLPALPVLDGET